MEKLIKKKQKQDAKDDRSTRSGCVDNTNRDDPFEEITRWFGSNRLDRVACPNPIAWWGVSLILYLMMFLLILNDLVPIRIPNSSINGTRLLGHSSNYMYRRTFIFYVSAHG
jgi:hypothetical protein